MRRVLPALLLALAMAPGTWFYQTKARPNDALNLDFVRLALPPRGELAQHLGAFELEGAWALTSRNSDFGGYSALLPQDGGRLLAIGDNGRWLRFSAPGSLPAPLQTGYVVDAAARRRLNADTEAATQDPATGTIWVAREASNAISRHDPQFHAMINVRPPAMRAWPENGGPEAMVRLADGRFIVLCEVTTGLLEPRLHPALLFAHDPLLKERPARFTFAGAPEFSVTDMAQMPDGRVLILMRRLVWPLPLRFAGRIMIADPSAIRSGEVWSGVEVAKLTSSLPVDNFEGLAIEPRGDGRITVWLISDDNHASTQRTLLWQLAVDPARLPWPNGAQTRKKARG